MNKSNQNKDPIFNCDDAIYMCAKREVDNCNLGIYGVNYDGTTSFRPGARFGPSSIRQVSNGIESFCPQLNLDLEDINFTDFGNLEINFGAPEPVIKKVKTASNFIYSLGMKPLLIGGEHSITIGSIQSTIEYFPNLILIQLDAHADLREEWLGSKFNHACVMRRCLEMISSERVFQVGIRSGTKKEMHELRKTKRLVNFISGQPAKELYNALNPHKGKPIYLTVDVDWFDPSVISGTGTPEPGGFTWQDFSAIINVLQNHKIIGADIVELAPQLDPSGVSSIVGAKITRSLIMLLSISQSTIR
ncbi:MULTISPECIES: agmatinase [Prochlorococcus]|uniref:Arginase family enzyme n=1 Tax=Prochlorococcus marinus (strain SARG / CCMP1375 / SS120) TaxID=167539 RepID=Q7V9I4_PROMA|nr:MULTISPECIES: agmatinase [Prochlorococcus]AAQ00893.1 Arginase family enzyme [Prochlorococcus marinus subsp. marinus str. CCMP1375]KGG10613.1 Agmatinase [Prochlorococcus marinus str. LG]KGG19921.1 Agmatinase [Prochlorococcus marinus str. SS2]KGG23859.1 Agmatinase [Prochlorococcus marinus str. SS35]KGG31881.1 Agmatinase [Prochlorococcus marinus str. SS51]